ncbi:MAG TPA: M56 family metallopeptidase [Pyrinomonadaceae bacterium]|nr:M56 family metallopeptidase [Pyrinomonadaceae bacterium]
MLITAIENFVLFSTLFALAGFVLALTVRQATAKELWRLRADSVARLYTSAVVTPPLAALWLVVAAFLPRLWLTPEAFEAAHSAPYHQLHLVGELTVALEPTLSYALALFVIVISVFSVWSNAAGSWRVGSVIRRLDLNAAAPPEEQVALVNDIAAQRDLAVGLVMTDYPLSFVWGFCRSKLILSSGLLRTLTAKELTGVLEHEAEHHARRDNLFKLLLSFCTYTSLVFPLSRIILRWRATEVEVVCDEAAAARTSAPLELAEALVKLRRQTISGYVAPEPAATTAVVSGFVSGNTLTFQYRVSRLLSLVDSIPDSAERRIHSYAKKATAFFVAASVVTLLAISAFAPLSVHHAAEALIQILK